MDPPRGGLKRDWREIRTLASEETGALNQRLRPLGHPAKGNLTGRIRTIDLGITAEDIYSPPLYQLSYGELVILFSRRGLRRYLKNRQR